MKSYNNFDAKGRLYNYELTEIDTDKGTAIAGTVTLSVDEDNTPVEMRFFARPTYNSGKPNRTYNVLEDMMAGNLKTVVDDGDEAEWLGMTGSIDVSYFAPRDGAKDVDEMVRAQKVRGSFINTNKKKEYANKWKLDMMITRIQDVEADEEKQTPHIVRVSGYMIDDYNERVMEVSFEARKEAAMNYFIGMMENVSVDQPHYTSLWGNFLRISQSIVRKNAFGEDDVQEIDRVRWHITGMNPDAYAFPDDSTMTAEQYADFRQALNDHIKAQFDKAQGDSDSEDSGLAF